jgi:hypothetical protein
MIATFSIEFLLAAYVLVRHRTTWFGRVAGFVLILLATFQFAEYQICTTTDQSVWLWPRIAFVAVTLLPISGLYLVSLISRKPHFLRIGYVTAAVFVLYFLFVPKSISHAVCGGNYVVFNMSNDLYRLYGFYYLGFLLLGIWESIDKIASLKRAATSRKTLQWLIVAYLSFMAPMGTVYVLVPITRNAVASIMCGFALAMAFILVFKVVPAQERIRTQGGSVTP